jgi:hypothetical protein
VISARGIRILRTTIWWRSSRPYATDWFDLRSCALEVLDRRRSVLDAGDRSWLVDLVRRSGNWAHVDHLSTKILGEVAARDPERTKSILKWSRDRLSR